MNRIKEIGKQFIKAKKSLGQNFCVDERIPAEIIAELAASSKHQIWEIGPGKGALTELLIKTGADLHLFEIDERMRNLLSEFCKEENITWGDFLEIKRESLPPVTKPLLVCGNLPYYCGTHIIKHFLELGPIAERLVFLLQREVSEKTAAQCGSKDYSYQALHTAFFAKAHLGKTYPPESFRPMPKIDSTVLIIEPYVLSDEERKERMNALKFASILFNQRRKMALPILKKQFPDKDWEKSFTELGIDFKARPEKISPEKMLKLFN